MKINEVPSKTIIGVLSLFGAFLFLRQTVPLLVEIVANIESILLGTYAIPQINKNVYLGFAIFAFFIGILISTFPSNSDGNDKE